MNNSKKYSYHQIIIFIKLFISQYNKLDSKLSFTIETKRKKKDVTEKCIYDFAKSSKYFIDGGYQNLIMRKIDEEQLKFEKKDYIDLLSNAYENDLKGKKIWYSSYFYY